MVTISVVTMVFLLSADGHFDPLEVRLVLHQHTVQILDPMYVKTIVKNTGTQGVEVPRRLLPELGTLRFDLYDGDTYTFRFVPDGCPMGDVGKMILEPGAELVEYQRLQLPRVDQLKHDFWNPGLYELSATVKIGNRRFASGNYPVSLNDRGDIEWTAIRNLLQVADRDAQEVSQERAQLGTFGLARVPASASSPVALTELEQKLSPGSLRHVVQLTRLVQGVDDSLDTEQRVQARGKLERFLSNLPVVEREWLVDAYVNYALISLKLPMVEMAEHFMPWIPDTVGGLSGRRGSRLEELRVIRMQIRASSRPKQ